MCLNLALKFEGHPQAAQEVLWLELWPLVRQAKNQLGENPVQGFSELVTSREQLILADLGFNLNFVDG